jgi:hypothetical protein
MTRFWHFYLRLIVKIWCLTCLGLWSIGLDRSLSGVGRTCDRALAAGFESNSKILLILSKILRDVAKNAQ